MTARQPHPDDPSWGDPSWGDPSWSDPSWSEVPTPPAGAPVPSSSPARAGRPTPPHGIADAPTRPAAGRAGIEPARAGRRARRRAGLAAVPTGAFPAVEATGGVPTTGLGRHRPSWLRRLVGTARVLTGGLIVLALVVAVVPLVLGTAGAGVDAVVGHIVGAAAALAATGVAAHRRVPTGPALAAAAAVPVIVLLVLAVYWWA